MSESLSLRQVIEKKLDLTSRSPVQSQRVAEGKRAATGLRRLDAKWITAVECPCRQLMMGTTSKWYEVKRNMDRIPNFADPDTRGLEAALSISIAL